MADSTALTMAVPSAAEKVDLKVLMLAVLMAD
jgi:hypothetical protein